MALPSSATLGSRGGRGGGVGRNGGALLPPGGAQVLGQRLHRHPGTEQSQQATQRRGGGGSELRGVLGQKALAPVARASRVSGGEGAKANSLFLDRPEQTADRK